MGLFHPDSRWRRKVVWTSSPRQSRILGKSKPPARRRLRNARVVMPVDFGLSPSSTSCEPRSPPTVAEDRGESRLSGARIGRRAPLVPSKDPIATADGRHLQFSLPDRPYNPAAHTWLRRQRAEGVAAGVIPEIETFALDCFDAPDVRRAVRAIVSRTPKEAFDHVPYVPLGFYISRRVSFRI